MLKWTALYHLPAMTWLNTGGCCSHESLSIRTALMSSPPLQSLGLASEHTVHTAHMHAHTHTSINKNVFCLLTSLIIKWIILRVIEFCCESSVLSYLYYKSKQRNMMFYMLLCCVTCQSRQIRPDWLLVAYVTYNLYFARIKGQEGRRSLWAKVSMATTPYLVDCWFSALARLEAELS